MKNLLTNTTSHGINNIVTLNNVTTYDGAFHHNPFTIRYSRNCFEMLSYKELNSEAKVDDEFTEIIDFIRNPNILKSYRRGVSA